MNILFLALYITMFLLFLVSDYLNKKLIKSKKNVIKIQEELILFLLDSNKGFIKKIEELSEEKEDLKTKLQKEKEDNLKTK